MNIKKVVLILVGVVLIAFSVALFSFNHNDKANFIDYITDNSNNSINIESKDGIVNIDKSGINILDGDDHVSIGWDGINISDGEDHFSLGWNGINFMEGNKSIFRFGNRQYFFNFNSQKLISHSIDEERFVDINNIDNIFISSSFVKIIVQSENRDDIRIHYHGNMKSNVSPHLMSVKKANNINIKLEVPNVDSQIIANSDVVLEVYIPKSFKGNLNTNTSSADIDLEDLIGGTFNISSSSGDLEIGNLEGEVLNLSTSSGDINIKFSEDANYEIIGSSSSGRYSPNVDMDVSENNKGDFKATIGSGEKSIDINTSSGDVNFNKR